MAARRTMITREEALADPSAVNDEINQVLAAAGNDEFPPTPEPADDLVHLPGGLIVKGKTLRTAIVRELNGSDEEALSRALRSGSAFHFIDTLLQRGTVQVGDIPATPELLKRLLIGDRDELALAIRIATYGPDMTIERWICPACESQSDISFPLTDEDVVPRVKLEGEAVFDIDLPKGAKARVRLPNGDDQDALFENDSWTTAERNSRLLSRCIQTYTDPSGYEHQLIVSPSLVLTLPIPVRQKIIREIAVRQPGPRYNEVKFTHAECGNEVILALGISDLFRELVLFL